MGQLTKPTFSRTSVLGKDGNSCHGLQCGKLPQLAQADTSLCQAWLKQEAWQRQLWQVSRPRERGTPGYYPPQLEPCAGCLCSAEPSA